MNIKAKLRPFYVAKMLYEQADEDHYLTIAQIMEQLEKEYGISTSRGTVGDDIKALQELGIEIEVVPSTQKRFSLICRKFDLPELKTLIDAVESARFIPKKKSAALVEKLGSLTSQHNTEKLVRNVDVENRLKADNEKIYYIMETLNDAINARKKVSFQYFTYNVRKEQKLKYDGYTYAYMIRRHEIAAPSNRDHVLALRVLQEGVKEGDAFSLVNTALVFALMLGDDESWHLADSIFERLSGFGGMLVSSWWEDLAKGGDDEGFLVIFFLLRHGKIDNDSVGSIKSIALRLAKSIDGFPEWLAKDYAIETLDDIIECLDDPDFNAILEDFLE